MTYLSSNQLKQYEDQGYISPIEVLSSSEALEARKEIELIEKKMPNEIDKSGRYNCLLYTSPSPRDYAASRMPSSA